MPLAEAVSAGRRSPVTLCSLRSGVKVALQERSSPLATVVCCVRTGSRHEAEGERGLTHLLEHALLLPRGKGFAGLPQEIERLGGEANGYTGKEEFYVFCRVPGHELAAALDALAHCLGAHDLRLELVEAERLVVVEELRACASDPADAIHDALYEALYGAHPLANPLGGAASTVRTLAAEAVLAYRDERVHAGTLGLVVIGGDAAETVELLDASAFAALAQGEWLPASPPPSGQRRLAQDEPLLKAVTSDYLYAALATGGFSYGDPRRIAADVLAMLLGGNSDSMLYRTLRNEHGLAYVLDCWHRCYSDSGLLRSVFAVGPEHSGEALRVARSAIEEALLRQWTPDEVRLASSRCAAQLMLEWESSVDYAIRLARHLYVAGMVDWTPERHIAALNELEADELASVAGELAEQGLVAAVAGNVEKCRG